MTKDEYADYLLTDHWLDVREQRNAIDGYKCVLCGSPYNLHVHHISYDRLWCEKPDIDLVTLCEDCHFKLHRALNVSEELISPIKEKYTDDFYYIISNNTDLKKLKENYISEIGKVYAKSLKEFAGEIPQSKEITLISLFNKHLCEKSSFGSLIMVNRIKWALFTKGKPDNPYQIVCKEFAQIRRQKRKF